MAQNEMAGTRGKMPAPSGGAFAATSTRRLLAAVACCMLGACGASPASTDTLQSAPPTILSQPVDVTVSLGQSATFAVEASGDAPLQYQWYWNGAEIPGANERTFTTRPAEVSDLASRYEVMIGNPRGAVRSRVAAVWIADAPSPPSDGDLRFQGVGAVPFRLHPTSLSRLFPDHRTWELGRWGTPLETGTGVCAIQQPGWCSWFYVRLGLPPSAPWIETIYVGLQTVSALEPTLVEMMRPDAVVTSMVLEDIGDVGGLSFVRLPGSRAFDGRLIESSVADFERVARAEGETSRVVTAVTFSAGQIHFLSYGWAGDTTTLYDVAVRGASLADAGIEAAALSAAGYIITAMGKDGTGGLTFVGTRIRGEQTARPLQAMTGAYVPTEMTDRGFAIVGYFFDETTATTTWIGQQ